MTEQRRLERCGYDLIRVIVGVFLLLAAALKAYQLTAKRRVEIGLVETRRFFARTIGVGGLLRLCLYSGVFAASIPDRKYSSGPFGHRIRREPIEVAGAKACRNGLAVTVARP